MTLEKGDLKINPQEKTILYSYIYGRIKWLLWIMPNCINFVKYVINLKYEICLVGVDNKVW